MNSTNKLGPRMEPCEPVEHLREQTAKKTYNFQELPPACGKVFFLHMHRPPLAYEVFDRPVLPSAQAIFVLCVGHFSSRKGLFFEKGHFLLKKRLFYLKLKSGLNRPKSNEFLQFLALPDTIFPVAPLFCHFRPIFWGQANMLACPAYVKNNLTPLPAPCTLRT